MDFYPPQIQVVPEYRPVNNMINDLALRVQQCLIGLECYENSLAEVDRLFPHMVMTGSATKDSEMPWGMPRSSKELIELQKRSKQFVILSGVNLATHLVDDFMKLLCKKYWNAKVPTTSDGLEDETWFSPESFEMLTGVKLTSLREFEVVEDCRRLSSNIRMLKRTRAMTVTDFFDYVVRINEYLLHLASLAFQKSIADARAKGAEIPEAIIPPPPQENKQLPPKPEGWDDGDWEEFYGEI